MGVVSGKGKEEWQVNSPDYKGVMSAEQAKDDFMKRIDNYKKQYEPLDMDNECHLSFIKVRLPQDSQSMGSGPLVGHQCRSIILRESSEWTRAVASDLLSDEHSSAPSSDLLHSTRRE